MVDRFAEDWLTAGLDDSTSALMRYAEKLTRKPGDVGRHDVEDLKKHGLDDAAISSCVQVVAYFNYINRVADGLGVPAEEWLDSSGRRREDV